MRELREPLLDKDQTGERMYALIERFHGDLRQTYMGQGSRRVRLSEMPVQAFYDLVRRIPYRRDTVPIEVVARPRYILKYRGLGMDCKKKGTLLGAYLRCQGLRKGTGYRLIASSSRRDRKVHHVFPQARINGHWTNLDATYPHYRLGQRKRDVTHAEVLK